MEKAIRMIHFIGRLACVFFLFLLTLNSNAFSAPSSYYDTVQKIYIGYYQRPADPAGLIYWAERLESSSGNLNEIIEAFANSEESQALYGTINSSNIAAVVNDIYNALFGRDAEAAGRDWYVSEFNAGRFTAATIMLNVLNGAQGADLQSVNNKLSAADLFTRTIDPELDGGSFQVTYEGEGDAIAGRNFLTLHATSATVPTQDGITAYLQVNIADPGDPILTAPTTSLIAAPEIALTKVTVLGTFKGIASLSIPFNSDIQASKIINIVLDLNNDGKWASYATGGLTQLEWIVNDMPARVLMTEMNNFTFTVNDPGLFGRTGMHGRVIMTDDPIGSSLSGQEWDGTIPSSVVTSADFVISEIGLYDPGELWTPDPVLSMGIPALTASTGTMREPMTRAGTGTTVSYHRYDVPFIQQKTGLCVPTATAMSLLWLAGEYAFKDRLPKDSAKEGDTLIEELRKALGSDQWQGGKGVKIDTDFQPGLTSYFNSFNPPLPLEAHLVGTENDADLFEKIVAELEKYQDVELDIVFKENGVITGGHMLTVVGATATKSGKISLEVYDPKSTRPSQNKKPLDIYEIIRPNKINGYKGSSNNVAWIRSARAISATIPHFIYWIPGAMDFKYSVGSVCPQKIGTLAIASTTDEARKWSISKNVSWLDVSETSGMTPGSVDISFNCSTTAPGNLTGNIDVSAVDPATGETLPGSQGSVTVTGVIEPQSGCPDLPGTYAFTVSGMTDPAEHSAYIGKPFAQPVTIAVADSAITITAQSPFVGVSGTLAADCSFTATGKGTVAGFPNVSVVMKGTYDAQTGKIAATYEMGAGGELPQGKSIIYSVSGHK